MRFKEIFDTLLFSLYPNRCIFCDELINAGEYLCPGCNENQAADHAVSQQHCSFCGADIEVCSCGKHSMFYNDIITPYYYEAEPMNTVIKYKFKYRREIAGFMAGKIAEKLDSIYPEGFFDCICFVPQTKDEMSKRGFNQAQLLASELSEIMETEIHCSIAKLYDTKRQHDLSSTERSGNVFGVFDITESEKITDKKILLVDDIKTTGATLNECAKMLKIRGAYSVTGAVFAIPRKGGRD